MEIKGKVHCLFEQEEWRPIQGYEGFYEVSNMGRVKSIRRTVRANTCGTREVPERILSTPISSCGYALAVLCKNGIKKNALVHRLVASAFSPNPLNLPEVNHKDEDRTNNVVDNLEWCDQKYNVNYGTGIQKCSEKRRKQVSMIDSETNKILRSFNSAREAYSITSVNYKSISAVCHGKAKTAGGYKWSFIK